VELPQLAEFARLATPLARFGKVGRAASKQKVAGSNPAGRAISLNLIRTKRIRKNAVHPRSTAKKTDVRANTLPTRRGISKEMKYMGPAFLRLFCLRLGAVTKT
jgi:hypothetical protein